MGGDGNPYFFGDFETSAAFIRFLREKYVHVLVEVGFDVLGNKAVEGEILFEGGRPGIWGGLAHEIFACPEFQIALQEKYACDQGNHSQKGGDGDPC